MCAFVFSVPLQSIVCVMIMLIIHAKSEYPTQSFGETVGVNLQFNYTEDYEKFY